MIKNILKILGDNKTLIFAWILYVLSPLVEMFRYKYQFWFFSANEQFSMLLKAGTKAYLWIFLVFNLLIMLMWYKNLVKVNYLKINHYLTLAIIALMTVFYEIAIRVLLFVNQSHYPNYVFSVYGIKPEFLRIMSVINYVFLAIIVALFFSVYESKIKKSKNLGKKISNNTVSLLNRNTIINVFSFIVLISMSIYPIVSIPDLIKESGQVYNVRIGKEYVYIEALSKLTPTDSFVIHPPQSNEWPLFGNQPIDRYFLFPRTLISGNLVDSNEFLERFGPVYFVLVTETANSPEWPKINQKEKQIVFDMHNIVRYINLVEVGVFSDKHVYKLEL